MYDHNADEYNFTENKCRILKVLKQDECAAHREYC